MKYTDALRAKLRMRIQDENMHHTMYRRRLMDKVARDEDRNIRISNYILAALGGAMLACLVALIFGV